MMEISCIIPTRDRCRSMLRAVASVKSQTIPVDEIIVADDGSIDGTLETLTNIHPDVITVRLSGKGPGPARNAGVARSSGDILMFLDSDDIWLKHHVQSLLEVMSAPFDVAYGTTRTFDSISQGEFLIPEEGRGHQGYCFDKLLRWCFLVPSSLAVTRKAYDAVEGYPSILLGEDWGFVLKLAARFNFGFAGQIPVTHRFLSHQSLCCLGFKKERLLDSFTAIRSLLHEDCGMQEDQIADFVQLDDWTRASGKTWSSIQEWYLDLKEEGMA